MWFSSTYYAIVVLCATRLNGKRRAAPRWSLPWICRRRARFYTVTRPLGMKRPKRGHAPLLASGDAPKWAWDVGLNGRPHDEQYFRLSG